MVTGITSQIRQFGKATLDLAIEVVFPPTCAGCGSLGGWICDRCATGLEEIDLMAEYERFPAIGVGLEIASRYIYADPIRRAIHLLKYQGQSARADWLAAQLEPLVEPSDPARAIYEPVPLTANRERSRGFNQSREIARHLSVRTAIPVGDGLRRIRDTRPQVELNGLERLVNVRGAFAAEASVSGFHVILIDDVVTTGSTLRECASACYRAGAATVTGITVAAGE